MKPSLLLLSHTAYSERVVGAHRGEIANTKKLEELLRGTGYSTEIQDIFELFEDRALYESFSSLNLDLAANQTSLLTETKLSEKLLSKLCFKNPDILFLLSWRESLAALFATGIQSKWPTISKLYVHEEDEEVNPLLYEPSDLLITESLLASTQAIKSGIPPWKIILLPHHTTQPVAPIFHRRYLERLIDQSKKKIPFTKETLVIGSVSRITYGKNVEYSLEALKKLRDQGLDIVFLLKGDFETKPAFPHYDKWLKKYVESYQDERWFLWDKSTSSHAEMGEIYAAFDIFLHMTSKEGGSNAILEALSFGKPSLILNASTNPSLFQKGALFIHATPKTPKIPFQAPIKDHLLSCLKQVILDHLLRKGLTEAALKVAKERFSPARTIERIPLILEAASTYHFKKPADSIKNKVISLYENDLSQL